MRITIEHEGRAVQYNFQDGAVAEVSMHRNEDGSTHDFTLFMGGEEMTREDDFRYCEDCKACEMCSWYPQDGCEFKIATPKIGEWIVTEHCSNEYGFRKWIEIECPFCGEKPVHEGLNNMNYCPNCGARMLREGGDTE